MTASIFWCYKTPVLSQSILNLQIFDGNSDSNTVVRHNLTKVITARYIRFQPTVWHVLASMRVELYGCFGNVSE